MKPTQRRNVAHKLVARKGATLFTSQKKEKFLLLIRATGNVGRAAEAVGIERHTAYNHRDPKLAVFDEEFAKRWDDAIEQHTDDLEEEGFARAFGELSIVRTPAGKVVKVRDENGKMVPLTKKKASDLLLIFMLKGNRPKYKDQLDVTSGGVPLADQAAAAKTTLLGKLFPKAKT